jgi:hypothetical protein
MKNDSNLNIDQRFGQIAGNQSVNQTIYHCFEYISKNDAIRFVTKFNKQKDNNTQVMHTFRELILGAYLNANGFNAKYELEIDKKTPDWCILNSNSIPVGIAECVNLEANIETSIDIAKQLSTKSHASYMQDAHKDNTARLLDRIQEKAQTYHDLVIKNKIFYIIATFVAFELKIDFRNEVYPYLFGENGNLFQQNPEVSAVLCFAENGPWYMFDNALNPQAVKPLFFHLFGKISDNV